MGTRYAAASDEPSLPGTIHGVEMWLVQLLSSNTRTVLASRIHAEGRTV